MPLPVPVLFLKCQCFSVNASSSTSGDEIHLEVASNSVPARKIELRLPPRPGPSTQLDRCLTLSTCTLTEPPPYCWLQPFQPDYRLWTCRAMVPGVGVAPPHTCTPLCGVNCAHVSKTDNSFSFFFFRFSCLFSPALWVRNSTPWIVSNHNHPLKTMEESSFVLPVLDPRIDYWL